MKDGVESAMHPHFPSLTTVVHCWLFQRCLDKKHRPHHQTTHLPVLPMSAVLYCYCDGCLASDGLMKGGVESVQHPHSPLLTTAVHHLSLQRCLDKKHRPHHQTTHL